MRNLLLTATAVAALALASGSAFAIGSGNLAPEASPYAILAPVTTEPGAPDLGRVAHEGRAAFTNDRAAPATVAPWAVQTPEATTYYSRGR
jgi:hypothetical protein